MVEKLCHYRSKSIPNLPKVPGLKIFIRVRSTTALFTTFLIFKTEIMIQDIEFVDVWAESQLRTN